MSEAESGGRPDPGNAPGEAGPAAGISEKEKNERMWAMFTHLSGLAGFTGLYFLSIVAPLVIWQMKKGDMPSIDSHGKEAVNFQISMTIYITISLVLCFVFIGILLIPIFAILDIVFIIIAALKANEGKPYEYPLTIRFIK